jgi:NADH:ubiquinone oxidoreductase subunit 6 (subunit J)
VLGALGLIFAKKAVHAALGMALVMINLGAFYIAQNADFLGIVQIFVYTGAVMMLFLFVLMLVGVDSSNSLVETPPEPDKACTVGWPGRCLQVVERASPTLLPNENSRQKSPAYL